MSRLPTAMAGAWRLYILPVSEYQWASTARLSSFVLVSAQGTPS